MYEPVVIIGGGQAGICLAQALQTAGIAPLVLERDRAFSSWQGTWGSFAMNTPNWMNRLPGATVDFAPGKPAGDFGSRADAIDYFDRYLAVVRPRLSEGEPVLSVEPEGDGSWRVRTGAREIRTCAVAVCTGEAFHPHLLATARGLSAQSLHSSEYRLPAQLSSPEALVVGSASSGTQICRELTMSGRFERVHLSVSVRSAVREKILGVSKLAVMRRLGLLDISSSSLIGRLVRRRVLKGHIAHHVSARSLARHYGVRLIGRFAGHEAGRLRFSDGCTLPAARIGIVWCTGFRRHYPFFGPALNARLLDENNYPRCDGGVCPGLPGLYFVGLKFQRTVSSHILHGVGRDAQHVAMRIVERLGSASFPLHHE